MPPLFLSASVIGGSQRCAEKGGGRSEQEHAAAEDMAGRDASVKMRGGADLHMHPMACPGRRGETQRVDMEPVTQDTLFTPLRGGQDSLFTLFGVDRSHEIGDTPKDTNVLRSCDSRTPKLRINPE